MRQQERESESQTFRLVGGLTMPCFILGYKVNTHVYFVALCVGSTNRTALTIIIFGFNIKEIRVGKNHIGISVCPYICRFVYKPVSLLSNFNA